MIIFIDLFCGAGGVTTGIERAKAFGKKAAKVIVGVNHDPVAIQSHGLNHKHVLHYVEDVRKVAMLPMQQLVEYNRKKYPHAATALWVSAECTNYSKAKGGKPKNADSRTLPEAIYRYVEALNLDYIFVENVVEFLSWGPLDENGKPVSRDNGKDFQRWKKKICSYGYDYDHRVLNAADFGAMTKRSRYFAQFARTGLPIVWPEATHAKDPAKFGIFGSDLKPWVAVKHALNLDDHGESIFNRKKPLVEATLSRIYAGLVKFVANGKHDTFFSQRFGGNPKSKITSIDEPSRTITGSGGNLNLVKAQFITKRFSGKPQHKNNSLNEPGPTITTSANMDLVQAFLVKNFSGEVNDKVKSIEEPGPTLTTKPQTSFVNAKFLSLYFSNGGEYGSIEMPAASMGTKDTYALVNTQFINRELKNDTGTDLNQPMGALLTNPKVNLVTTKQYLLNPQFTSKGGSIEDPAFTLIARMDKAPPHIVTVEPGNVVAIAIYDTDSPMMIKIKEFMAEYGIVDIMMRMLHVPELLQIQGFPKDYYLAGSKTHQKKFIGNSVPPPVAEAIVAAASSAFRSYYEKRQAA
ncbi:MAG: DNA cytosine methyltransferase [Chryseolinea sp.]